MRKSNNGNDSLELALLLENIGNVYRVRGELGKARAYQEESLNMIVEFKGKTSVEAVRILNNLGNVYA